MTAFESQNLFWDFSLELYGRPGVSAACLGLQDEAGLDVNLLLFCIWMGRAGRLDGPALTRCIACTTAWQGQIVAVLRELRRRCREDSGLAPAAPRAALYREISAVELHAERVEQDLLFALSAELRPRPDGPDGDGPENAAANIHGYLAATGVAMGDRERRWVRDILAAAFSRA